MSIDASEVRRMATGQWAGILQTICGLPAETFNRKGQPCPKCGGEDRFSFEWPEDGGAICRKCFDSGNGNGFQFIMWYLGCDFPEALRLVADHLGMAPASTDSPTAPKPVDLLQYLANVKGCTREGLAEYGAEVEGDRVIFPMYGPDKLQCGTFRIWPRSKDAGERKGKCSAGKGSSGVFIPFMDQGIHFPVPGETWIVCEGVKDSAAWYSLGYHAAGVNGEDLVRQKFVPLFRDVHVILAPDRTTQAEQKANESAARLYGVAASIRICQLPLKISNKEGSTNAKR